MTTALRVALIQMNVVYGQPAANREKAMTLLTAAAEKGAQLAVLPELWTTGMDLNHLPELGEKEEGPTLSLLREVARRHRLQIIGGSIVEEDNGQFYNTSYIINDTGEVCGKYRKVHLFPVMNEDRYLGAGNATLVAEVGGIKIGAGICYELRFPELARSLALQGAQILAYPAEFPHPRLAHWRTLLIARAIENQLFVVACNRVGQDDSYQYFGHSLVIDPWGEVLAEGTEEEAVITADLKLDLIREVRERITCFQDRRPELY